jgi:hypothetical protein
MKKPNIDRADVLALLGVGILAVSAAAVYVPAGGILVGLYLLAVAKRKG